MTPDLTRQLLETLQESTRQAATTAQAVKDLADRFDRFEKRVFGPDGISKDVDEIQNKFSYAKGYLAGWACAIGLGSAGAAITVQTLLKKIGWIS